MLGQRRFGKIQMAVLVVIALVMGANLISPAVAHVTRNLRHLYKHLDKRYINVGEKATSAATADNATNATNATTANNANNLGGVPAAQYARTNAFERKTSVNGGGHSVTTNAYANITGASVSLTIPPGASQLVVARFAAESVVTGDAGDWCSVRIVAGATEMSPAIGLEYAFDSANTDVDFWEGHMVERSITLAPGTYTIAAQGAQVDFGADNESCFLDDIHFVAERMPAAGAPRVVRGAAELPPGIPPQNP